MGHHSLVPLIADDVGVAGGREVGTDERLHVSARIGLVSQNVQRGADQSVADEGISRVGRLRRDGAERLGGRKRDLIVTCDEVIDIQPKHRSQAVLAVVLALGKVEGFRQRGDHLRAADAVRMQEDDSQREKQLHVAARAGGDLRSEMCKRLFDPDAAFRHQR